MALLASCSSNSSSPHELTLRRSAQQAIELGQYEAAEKQLVQAVDECDSQKRPSCQLSNVLQQLAYVYLLDGKYSEAEKNLSRARQLHESSKEKDANCLILDSYLLGTIYTKQGRFAEAEPVLRQALTARVAEIQAKRDGVLIDGIVPSPRLAAIKVALGTMMYEAGRYRESESELKEAIELAESDSAGKQVDAVPILANALQEAALVYQVDGKFDDAEAVCKNGMRLLRDAVGMHHPYFIAAANNLISIYCDQHKYSKSEQMIQSLTQTENQVLRKDHPECVRSGMLNVISIYHMHVERDATEPRYLFNYLTNQDAETFGSQSPQVSSDYEQAGEFELSMGDYKEAEPKLRTALTISRATLGDQHPKTIHSLNSLALTLGLKGIATKNEKVLVEASKLAQEAVKTSSQSLREEAPDRCRSLGILASLQAVSGNYDQSYRIFHQYLDAAKKSTFEEPAERNRFLANYFNVLDKLGLKHSEGTRHLNQLVSSGSHSH